MRACIFPNGPLYTHQKKGYVIPGYYNPGDFFDEIDFLVPAWEDLAPSEVQILCGRARVRIHPIGRINALNLRSRTRKAVEIARNAQPDVIRAYNPFYGGYIAARCARELGIPFWVSLHTQPDGNRDRGGGRSLGRLLVLKYTGMFVEPFVLKQADKVTARYSTIIPYVKRHTGKNPEIIYGGVDLARFGGGSTMDSLPRPLVLSVGRLTAVKGHGTLINAMKDVDAHLLIIGDGELHGELRGLAEKIGISKRVIFKQNVPHSSIHDYYRSADVFALAYNPRVENVPIPVMEAMASGLPLVVPRPAAEEFDGFEDAAVHADDPASFAAGINMLLSDKGLRKKYAGKSRDKAAAFDIGRTASREAEIYAELAGRRPRASARRGQAARS